MFPFARGTLAQDSFSRVQAYYTPCFALYLQWLHQLSKAMVWLAPLLALHELYLCVNDYIYPGQNVDDFDNRFTIVLCMLLPLWALHVALAFRDAMLHRFAVPPPSAPAHTTAPAHKERHKGTTCISQGSMQHRQSTRHTLPSIATPTCTAPVMLRVAAAAAVTLFSCFISLKVSEAKVVYQVYSRDDFARDNNHNGTLAGPSLNRVYKFVVQVRARPCTLYPSVY